MRRTESRIPLTFTSASTNLSGDLYLPPTSGLHPAVVLLHGAGWGTREYYAAHVEAFTEAGLATFVFDRRGEGQSGGSPEQDILAFAQDARAAFRAVSAVPEIHPERVGLWGYSNGAWVAGLAASELPECAFLVLTGASGVSPAVSEVFRRVEDLRAQGVAPDSLGAVRRTWEIVFDYISFGQWDERWDAELASLKATMESDAHLQGLPVTEMVRRDPALDSIPRMDSPILANLRTTAKGINPGMGFDPIPALRKVTCPVLAVLAEHDRNLPTAESVARFAEVAASRKGTEFRIEVLPGASHQFTREVSPSVSTDENVLRPKAREEFREGYLELMAGWMAEHALSNHAVRPDS